MVPAFDADGCGHDLNENDAANHGQCAENRRRQDEQHQPPDSPKDEEQEMPDVPHRCQPSP